MSDCKWCGVERDAPAVGPHVCDPQRVWEKAEAATSALWEGAMRTADWDGGVFHYEGRIFPWPSGFVPDCPATWESKVGPLRKDLEEARAWIAAYKEWRDVTTRLLRKVAIQGRA